MSDTTISAVIASVRQLQVLKVKEMAATERIIASILLGQAHREARHHYLTRLVFAVAALLVLSLLGTGAMISKPEIYRYVLLERGGKVLSLVPLDQPKQADDFVVRWAVNATLKLHTYDFLNYQRQLEEAKRNMTVFGWGAYEKALEESGNFKAVISNRYASTAVPAGPGRILKKGDLMGRFAWRIQFPILVTYQSSSRTTTQNMLVTVVVVRQPEFVQADGLGIRSIIAE